MLHIRQQRSETNISHVLHRYYKHVTIVKTPLLLKQGRKKKVITLRVFLLKCDYNIIVINFQSLTDHKDDILQWLCEMALTDSQAAFKSLYLTYFQRLIRFTRLYVSSTVEAEEIVSDTFLAVWNNRKSLLKVTNFDSYIYSIARHKAISYYSLNVWNLSHRSYWRWCSRGWL